MGDLSITDTMRLRIAGRVPLRRYTLQQATGCLSICFDDIPRTAWTCGGPLLQAHGVTATYYLNGALCGTHFEEREQYRREDAEAIFAAGHEIGSHLYNHVSVLELSPSALRDEIAKNDRFFSDIFGPAFRARSFAYPYGHLSLTAKWLCGRRFDSCRSVAPGLNEATVDADRLRIVPLDSGFEHEVDWHEIIPRAAREKAWIIALAHGVEERSHTFSCRPEMLEKLLVLAKEAGLAILPVGEALDTRLHSSERAMA